eukprot:3551345-Alexandrium_andersonii.AAC.1
MSPAKLAVLRSCDPPAGSQAVTVSQFSEALWKLPGSSPEALRKLPGSSPEALRRLSGALRR